MRTETRWLALLFVGACGTAASAQSPYMHGMRPAYPYPQPYSQARPSYATARPAAPPSYQQPRPQPRIMYVPATWNGGPIPTQTATFPGTVPAAPVAAAPAPWTPAPIVPGSDNGSLIVLENSPGPKTVPATPTLHRKRGSEEVIVSMPESCGPEGGDACVAPPACVEKDDCPHWLPKGSWTFQWLGGVYSDVGDANYNWAQTSFRFGKILNGECLSHLPGALETLVEFNAAAVTEADFGDFFTGGGFLLRYNFVQPCSRLVPYIQGGVGFQYNDAYQDETQPYLGSRIELTAQAQVGLKLFLTKSLSLDFEGGVQHISNLNMSERDNGINAVGAMGGLTYYLPCGGKRRGH